jgi:hypothetical protein
LSPAAGESQRIFIASFDAAGHRWSKSFGGAKGTSVSDLGIDSAGNIIVTGKYWTGSSDLGGGALPANGLDGVGMYLAKFSPTGSHLWSKGFGLDNDSIHAEALAVSKLDAISVAGMFLGTASFGSGTIQSDYHSEPDVFVTTFDASGSPVWTKHLDDNSGSSGVDDLVASPDGSLFLTGKLGGALQFGFTTLTGWGGYVAKLVY